VNLEARIATIEAMSGKELKAEWERLMNSPPPPAFGKGLLARALTYHLQEKAFGGLSGADRRRIRSLAARSDGSPADAGQQQLRPGTWLSRTWHGEVHQVVVLESGVDYRGARYSSLSAVAREITGAHWSGPRFFGLQSPRLGKLGVTNDAQ
jgi:hypothetical protein